MLERELRKKRKRCIGVTLREGDREYYYAALDRHFPGLKEKYHKKYGYSYEIRSDNHDALMRIFYDFCKQHSIVKGGRRSGRSTLDVTG